MEYPNKVELKGIVGNVRVDEIGGTEMARFTLATDHTYKSKTGDIIIETTWHEVVAFKNQEAVQFEEIQQGAHLHVIGRIRKHVYHDSAGNPKDHFGIIVNSVEAIKN